jgi:hypothetical protein
LVNAVWQDALLDLVGLLSLIMNIVNLLQMLPMMIELLFRLSLMTGPCLWVLLHGYEFELITQ